MGTCMKAKIFLYLSIKTKVALFTLLIFMVGIWSLMSYARRELRGDLQHLIFEHQFATVSILASDINTELDDRLKALGKVASKITPATLGDAASMQAFLEARPAFQGMFNNGVFVTRLDGTVRAEVPLSVGRLGGDYSDRDFIAGALKGKTTIGKPVIGRKLHVPLFAMAAPIRDTDGKVIGALVGSVDLSKPNFLEKIAGNRFGKTGGYILAAPQHKLFVTASDKSYSMRPIPAPGINPLMDRYLRGFEGSGSVVDARGVAVLSSARQIPVAGWVIIVRIPVEEAFAPIRAMQCRMRLAAVILTLLAGGLTWWLLKRQLSPVFDTLKTLSAISDANLPVNPLPIVQQDEVGQLISGFNHLLEALAQREVALKESEATTRKSEERYRQLFQNQPAGYALHEILSDAEGKPCDYRFIEVNTAFEKLTGLTAIEILGKAQSEVMPNRDAFWVETYGRVAQTGKSVTFENFSEESNRYYQISAYAPEPGTCATVFLDITDRKRAERENQEREQQSQQNQRLESLGVLAGGIAHDFNNILAIIMGYCSLAKMSDDSAKENIPQIERAAERAAELCGQMLAYAGKSPFVVAPVNMGALVDEMVKMLKATTSQNAVITDTISADIPFIQGDASQIRQIVMNLIINASEAIGEARGEIRVSLATAMVEAGPADKDHLGRRMPAGRYLCLQVADTGCGMDEGTKGRIFEPFYTTKFTGRGLGMSAVLGIITAHNGSLQLFSQPGRGTTVKVFLPVRESDLVAVEPTPETISTPWRGSGTILVAEDEAQVLMIMELMLEELGFTVLAATNGFEALELFQENAAEILLVVTDMGMPGMDGYELFRELK